MFRRVSLAKKETPAIAGVSFFKLDFVYSDNQGRSGLSNAL
jgi:hypothetical protein